MENRQERKEPVSGRRGSVLRARDVMGGPVVNRQGESLGTIEDIVFDIRSGRMAYAVLSFGGFFGRGNTLVAIPWRALQFDTVRNEYVLDIPREQLEKAPGFDREHWPDMANREWQVDVDGYYGYRLYWEAGEEYGRRAA